MATTRIKLDEEILNQRVAMEYITWSNLLLWFIISLMVYLIGSLCSGDPGVSDTENVILMIIIGIIGLPVTILAFICYLVTILIFKRE